MSRVAVITGGASGIGFGVAARLSNAGHRVALLDVQHDAVAAAESDLRITVNTIPPSIIDTPMARAAEAEGRISLAMVTKMTPVRPAGVPDDVAAACEFLCSDDASFITGQQIGVNGGWYL